MPEILLVGPPFLIRKIEELVSGGPLSFRRIPTEQWDLLAAEEKKEAIRGADLVHFFWGQRKMPLFIWAKRFRTKTINHYIGTDALRLVEAKSSKKFKAYACNRLADRTVCVSPGLQDELKSIGIQADLLPFSHKSMPVELPPLPREPAAYTYLPQQRAEFYGMSLVEKLAREFEHVKFYILAHDGKGIEAARNVRFLGWQEDISPWIERSHIHLRLTLHDGLPNSIVEALANGRQVIWSFRMSHCRQATNFDELSRMFSALLESPALNTEGARYVRENFHPDIIRGKFLALYNDLCGTTL